MKKMIILLFIPLFGVSGNIRAQLAPELTKKYPWHILARILEVSTKVNLPLEKQLLLADFFKVEDSLANASLKSGYTAESIGIDNQTTKEKLSAILSRQELNQYMAAASSTSAFSEALYNKAILQLDTSQIKEVEEADRQLKEKLFYNVRTRNSYPFSQELFEGQQLKTIFNETQYARFLVIVTKAVASKLAAESWFALKNAHLLKDQDSTEQSHKVMNYYVFKQASILRIAHGVDYAMEDSLKRSFNRFKPNILIKLDTYTGREYTSQLANAVKFRKELKLSESQLNHLLDAQVFVERKRATQGKTGKSDPSPFESIQLNTILSNQQYNDFLYLDMQKTAEAYTNDTWLILTKFGLTKSVDSAEIVKEIFNYSLEKAVASAKKRNGNHSAVDLDSLIRTQDLSRPLILYKLDGYRYDATTAPVNQFAAAIKYRKQIVLTDQQLDSLFKKNRDFEILKNISRLDIAHGRQNGFDVMKYESAGIISILETKQFTLLLQLKNYKKAQDITAENWSKIKQHGLSSGLDSTEVNKQNLGYQITLLAATERANFDHRPETEAYRRQAESRKPPILAKLEDLNRKKTIGLDTKRTFAW